MRKIFVSLLMACGVLLGQPALAGSSTDDLSRCLVDSLNGKERKQLAQWVFVVMSAHPEIQKFSNVSASNRDDLDRLIGNLVTRLLTEDCPAQTQNASKSDGQDALRKAFEVVGQVAMRELMNDASVQSHIGNFGRYLDNQKINQVLYPPNSNMSAAKSH